MADQCNCLRCLRERDERIDGQSIETCQMIICPTCGCKRCPHATDHRNTCTGSNDVGQIGSLYGTSPPDLAPAPAMFKPVAPEIRGRATAAETCRQNGWQVGDVLEGDEDYGPTRIRITAIGEEGILARPILQSGRAVDGYESPWNLAYRDWRKVDT